MLRYQHACIEKVKLKYEISI